MAKKLDLDGLQQLARDVAQILGAEYEHRPDDMWRAVINTPDGLRLIMAQTIHGQNKPGVYSYTRRNSTSNDTAGDSASCGSIGCTLERGAAAVAKEITARLLPSARQKAAEARARWAKEDATANSLGALAAAMRVLPDVSAEVKDAGRDTQHVSGRFYHPDKGSLGFTVYPSGAVYVDRLHVNGKTDQMATLKRVLAVMDKIGAAE